MVILAYITDLFFQARVAESAKQLGLELKITASLYKFIPALQEGPGLIIIDLGSEGIDGQSLIAQIKGSHPEVPVIAFAAHVDERALEEASKAGADQVLSRSKFTRQLPELLRAMKREG